MERQILFTGKNAKLSHRERVLLSLQHRETDRIPLAMICSGINPPADKRFDKYLREHHGTTLQAYLDVHLDAEMLGIDTKKKLSEGFDIWGVHRSCLPNGKGGYNYNMDYRPLANAETLEDLARHVWPTVEMMDYEALATQVKKIRATTDKAIVLGNGNIFETSWYMRGFEEIFIDLATAPDFAHALFTHVADFYIEYLTCALRAIPSEIDLVFTADDIAGQEGLLMSLPMWEEFIKPHHRRLNDRIHELGAKVIYHSDGAVMEAVPGFIDMGIDVLQALQFDATAMCPETLKKLYGDRLCFEGGVSVQHTLPFGTLDDVRREVTNLISTLGKSGGYILGPSHVIQEETPAENIATMFETALNF